MSNNRLCKTQCESDHANNKQKRGPSSFWMHDPELVFGELKLKEGDSFLDIGCGTGDYSVYASKIVRDSGVVYALDIQKELINNLRKQADLEGLNNINAIISDIAAPLPVEDNIIDVCFISTVLHSVNLDEHGKKLFSEIGRVLKPEGRLVIIECKKENLSRGPPLHMRISVKKINLIDLGSNYMVKFGVKN